MAGSQPRVILVHNPGPDRTHGAGLDLALQWCRERGAEAMLHFEPDCYITGAEWYRELIAAVEHGAWMATTFRKSWGPLHPCPSIWNVREVRASFRRADGRPEAAHPRFAELVDVARFERDVRLTPEAKWRWDTGLKAWFEAALAGRAVQVSGKGITHYWRGSQTRRDDLRLFLDPRLVRYTRPSLRQWTLAVTRRSGNSPSDSR